jgi:hypothetical protein
MNDLLSHWNDFITFITFCLTIIIGYHQIEHYRAERASVRILDINDADYSGQVTDRYGDLADSTEGDFKSTRYSMNVSIENSGRNPATISDMTIVIYDTDEALSLSLTTETMRRTGSTTIKMNGGDRRKIPFTASGKIRENYPDKVEGRLRMDTTVGTAAKEVVFERS